MFLCFILAVVMQLKDQLDCSILGKETADPDTFHKLISSICAGDADRLQHVGNKVQCPVHQCEFLAANASSLNLHLNCKKNRHHLNNAKRACYGCNRMFDDRQALMDHRRQTGNCKSKKGDAGGGLEGRRRNVFNLKNFICNTPRFGMSTSTRSARPILVVPS